MALLDWLDERTGIRSATRLMLEEDVPGGARLRYVFGSVLVFLFMQQVVLGILLAFYYSPSATDAWASTAYLNDQVTYGWFLRGLHHHGSSAMVVVVVLHLLQVVFAGAYRKPREVNWWTGLLMGAIVLAFALTGYLLPWDQKGYWATQVATGIMGSVPGGEPMQQFVQGGSEYGNLTLTRFFALHVFVLPIALAGLLGVHLLLFRKHGVTPPDLPEPELRRKTQPFWPNQLFLDVLAMAVCAAVLVGLTVQTHGAELFAPADPASNFVARPEWYFLFLFQLLKYFQGPLQIVATVLLPGAAAAYLFALPFVDRSKSRAVRSRWSVLSGVGLLMAGVTALTAVAIVEDGGNESFQHGVEQAHAEAARARELAREGVAPVGGVAVFDNDPEQKTRNLFKEQCATCHTLEGKGSEEAPTLDGFTSREWLAALVRSPRDRRFYGATKHNTMEPLTAEQASDEELAAVVEYLVSLSGASAAASVDAATVARGKELWDKKLECSSCHELEAGKEGAGPTLAGRGSPAWIARIIRDSSQKDLYGDTAEMPKFADKLSTEQIEALAQFVASRKAP
ncbi:cytochrome b N-terminal domain-containing protein [Nannocystis bainbridge]|uniref:Cytochrome b N-terminal domain-containing protein n=1 Tax=Nannocystis bainbridge TaxID=2995303 RepID=A0ABT5DTL2_9BACT|nr:cytochrome b N-terminal domain-containing protein [Nannocystis bainbridge]MDC0716982.1 cytochrome b N-terminal domain-containing protein [Nannocystis bainbridge]